ncbi:ketol-acid reductoisomerase [Candidatus Tremblaya phenacola]|uniref:Ketol-acid reductoisomerase (NADP(+)) n=1 Tax=Candidatus Tremblayella phenacoccinincola TaxID=1010676 RepID=A0A2G0V744_9PROT|nr:ketol-acid reductoisomerase [Candidatus Tremblaya phenacola]PHN16290.1 Ketol-acid reductoisomerase [Candidatus Tremblaya phenacola]
MKLLYTSDGNLDNIKSKSVTIVGYGSQGHAHALNLRDSGIEVTIGLRPGLSWASAIKSGFVVKSIPEAVRTAELVMMLIPDEDMRTVYETEIHNNIKKNSTLAFAHGFNVHYNQIIPRCDLNVIMVAPKAPGHMVRETYLKGHGVPHLIAVWRDCSNKSKEVALAYAIANGGGFAGIIETSFKDETETDLFGEQVVLCGGLTELIKAGFETLIEHGYKPELAYFECIHEVKLIVDLIYQGGISGLNRSISNNAEYGEYTVGPRVINESTKIIMKDVLNEIQTGNYAKSFILEKLTNSPTLTTKRNLLNAHLLEKVGRVLRAKMSWAKG